MSEVLGTVFSRADAFKRKLIDALRNPVAKAEQLVGDVNDRARGINELTSEATNAHLARLRSGEIGMSEPEMRLAQVLADSYAMGGMVKPVGPRAAALEAARKNAVKMFGLAESNTATDRAKAMGFQDIGAHYTKSDFGKFRSGTRPDNFAVWATKDPSVNMAAHNIGRTGELAEGTQAMPLMARLQSRMPLTEKRPLGLSSDFPRTVTQQDASKAAQAGYDHATIGTEIAVLDPSRIRSRFAAFDPARVNEADLLGRAYPALLAALGVGTAATVAALR